VREEKRKREGRKDEKSYEALDRGDLNDGGAFDIVNRRHLVAFRIGNRRRGIACHHLEGNEIEKKKAVDKEKE